MGANVVPTVQNFSIHHETFTPDGHDVRDEVVTPGEHELLGFDQRAHNVGYADFVAGPPASQPDLFVWSAGHDHYHLQNFNEFLLLDSSGEPAAVGYKQGFCLRDDHPNDPPTPGAGPVPHFDGECGPNKLMGISAGWSDLYDHNLPGQYVVLDGVPDGDYTLQVTTNAQHVVPEDNYADNTVSVGLSIHDDTVHVIDPPIAGFNIAALGDSADHLFLV